MEVKEPDFRKEKVIEEEEEEMARLY